MEEVGLAISQINLGHDAYLIWMDDQHCLPVVLLHLIWSYQVSHAHLLPAGLPLPQYCVQSGQQSSDVALLPLNPVQDLQRHM